MSALEHPPARKDRWLELVTTRSGPNAPAREKSEVARVQQALSTTDRLTVGSIEAAAHAQGLHGAGGDFVELLEADGRLIALLGDVSGKGVAASLVAAVLLSSFQHHVALHGGQAGVLMAAVNASVRKMLDRTGALVTVAIVVVDPAAQRVSIASAGHHPVVMAADRSTTPIAATCPPLGASDVGTQEVIQPFTPGTTLVLTSDGITEQANPTGEFFGLDRLARLAEDARRRSPAAAIARVLHAVDFYADGVSPSDDRAVVVIRAGLDP